MIGFLLTTSISLVGAIFSSGFKIVSAFFTLFAVLAIRWVVFYFYGHLPNVGVIATLSPLPFFLGCLIAEQIGLIPQNYLSRIAALGLILSAGMSLYQEWMLLAQHVQLANSAAAGGVNIPTSRFGWGFAQFFVWFDGFLQKWFVVDVPLVWASFLNIVAAGVYLSGIGKKWADRGIEKETKSIHGTSKFATSKIIRNKMSDGPLTLGLDRSKSGQRLQGHVNGHCLTVAPTGAGKTTSVAIPNSHDWPDQLVVFDPKGDIVDIVAEERKRRTGRDYVSIDARRGKETGSLDVLSWIDPASSYAHADIDVITAAFVVDDIKKTSNDKTFDELARQLFKIAILEVLSNPSYQPEDRTLASVRAFLTNPRLMDVLSDIDERAETYPNPKALKELIGQVLVYSQASDRTFGSVLATLEPMTNWLSSPSQQPLVCGSAGKVVPLERIRDRSIDVYITIPLGMIDATPSVARVLLAAIFQQFLVAYETGQNRDGRTLFIIDEMPRLKKFELLEKIRDAGRGLGIVLWPLVQDLSQLTHFYGKEGRGSWLSSADIITFFGIRELETAKYLSEMLGNRTAFIRENSTTLSNSKGIKGIMGMPSKSKQESNKVQSRRLKLAEEIIQMPNDELVIMKSGVDPIEAKLLRYFERAEYQKLQSERQT